ncbi:MAG: glycosyltransferase family 1 protein [Candidatus Zixiibacteriota bacterium]|nr:MAG: glycosyltransferase family 1 protein [candidate division Zixibacteria bacterium]
MVKALRYVQVEPILPDVLKSLKEIALNLWWCLNQEAIRLFRQVDSRLWEETGHNPIKVLAQIPQEKLEKLEKDLSFRAHLESVYRDLVVYQHNSNWFNEQHFQTEQPEFAYFSAEFGITECLPIYSGGLGVLAGDYLKSASDLGLPLVGIGLLYQRCYFQQYLNADGWQQEYYPEFDFSSLPVTEANDRNGQPLMVNIDFPGRKVWIKVWKLQVGRTPLYLLDTNVPQNSGEDRDITAHLYGGDNDTRIRQEMVLGIGGVTALDEMGIAPSVFHMNEGHSAFLAIDRVRRHMEKDGLTFREASLLVRQTTVFTTHTPVQAGIDRFPRELVEKYFRSYLPKLGLSFGEFSALGQQNERENTTEFNMAHLAMNFSSFINGVSKLHAEVSRRMWQASWPKVPFEEIPLASITNGVHTRSWISAEMSELYDRYLGIGWLEESANHSFWSNVDDINDSELWRTHEIRREKMISFVRHRLKEQYQRRGATASDIKLVGEVLNAGYLTIGFARRFASYKRGTLIFRDMERLKRILNQTDRPVQLIFAGKAHPRDNFGKELIKTIVHLARDPQLRDRIVFLENYDLAVARNLVQGVDVWLNTPRRPMEASGTSGMKVIFNGGINFSVLDGWWCEGYNVNTGWAIGLGEEYDNLDYQDEVEANALYDTLEKEIVPLFYDRGRDGIPRDWVAKMKNSIKTLAPIFNSNRMVQEYTEMFYVNAYRQNLILRHQGFAEVKSLANWYKHLVDKWADIRMLELVSKSPSKMNVNEQMQIEAKIFIGELTPNDVAVELYMGKLSPSGDIVDPTSVEMTADGNPHAGIYNYHCTTPISSSGRLGYSVRVLPGHRSLVHPHEMRLITWAEGDL